MYYTINFNCIGMHIYLTCGMNYFVLRFNPDHAEVSIELRFHYALIFTVNETNVKYGESIFHNLL